MKVDHPKHQGPKAAQRLIICAVVLLVGVVSMLALDPQAASR